MHPTFVALTLNPSPKAGEGFRVRAPLLPFWEKGLGDEGKLAKLGCTLGFRAAPYPPLAESTDSAPW